MHTHISFLLVLCLWRTLNNSLILKTTFRCEVWTLKMNDGLAPGRGGGRDSSSGYRRRLLLRDWAYERHRVPSVLANFCGQIASGHPRVQLDRLQSSAVLSHRDSSNYLKQEKQMHQCLQLKLPRRGLTSGTD